jgi:hypothetical protein
MTKKKGGKRAGLDVHWEFIPLVFPDFESAKLKYFKTCFHETSKFLKLKKKKKRFLICLAFTFSKRFFGMIGLNQKNFAIYILDTSSKLRETTGVVKNP